MSQKSGSLHIILGPMFSGKTTRLMDDIKAHTNYVVVNYAGDRRYDDQLLSTHDKRMCPCIQAYDLTSISHKEDVITASAIFINEAQLFGDLYDIVLEWVEKDRKDVYVYGLDGDFRREIFGDIYRLLPLCNSVVKLAGQCAICGNAKSLFSKRVSKDIEQIVIGTDIYKPVCRDCFF